MERLRMTCAEFKAMPEYSATYPTGTTIGKRWRRLNGIYDEVFLRHGGKPYWQIGEYVDHPDPKKIGIKWWKPVIIVSADTSPVIPYRDLDILHRIAESG